MPTLPALPPDNRSSDDRRQQLFLAIVLPRLQSHAAVCLRDVRCPDERAELQAELFALGWAWFTRLLRHGKKPETFPTAIATFAGRAVRSGRRLCGQLPATDVLSPLAQRRHGFSVGPLPAVSTLLGNVLEDALRDNTQTPPDEQAAFRVDFPAWVERRPKRDRRLIRDMMRGERTGELADKFGLTAGRVSQLRREFHDDWSAFCGEGPVLSNGVAATG
jgi:hypothetical protein